MFSVKVFILLLIGSFTLANSHLTGVVQAQEWDFPRLDEIYFKIKYPYPISIEAAKACLIDTYVGAIRLFEINTLKDPPYNWTVTSAPGFHMCYIGINCRGTTIETSGTVRNYHNREPGFELYPLELAPFRYALELIVSGFKDAWIWDIYGVINVRLDTSVPPANVYWYNPEITPYPEDWDQACEMLYAAGFTGTVGGCDWIMPNSVPLVDREADPVTHEKGIFVMSPISAPTTTEVTRRHVKKWNMFFCGVEGADYPGAAPLFHHEPIDPNVESDVAFNNRDHDIYYLCWSLSRNPDCLYRFFHPDMDIPDGDNTPGLNYRPLNILLKALHDSTWDEYFEKSWIGLGPTTVPASTTKTTKHAFVSGTEELWIGVKHASPDFPWYYGKLVNGTDYETVVDASGNGIAIRLLQDITIPDEYYIHIVYKLVNARTMHTIEELRQICWDAQWILYYACPYLPFLSRNYHDLYKPGLTYWVPSLGYGSAAYQLKWTYASIHWEGTPVGGTVNWHLPERVYTLHPWLATWAYEFTIHNRIYDSMIEIDAYTHNDIPWLALSYKIEDWTGPMGETGMVIIFWIRNDITWQDGDHVTADDWIWQYEFINSIKPSSLSKIWSTYHGCVKYSDYCFGIKINATSLWKFYDYTMGLVYPRKVWEPFWGNKAAAEAFKPWEKAYTAHVAPEDWGPTPPPTCLMGTAEWIFDYLSTTLGTIKVYKNPNWWGRLAAQPCRQMGGIYSPTVFGKEGKPINIKTVIGLYTLNLDTKENCTCTWALLIDGNPVANGTQTLAPLAFHKWLTELPALIPGFHTFQLRLTNIYGTNTYTAIMFVLTGDVNNDYLTDMADISILIDMFQLEIGQPGFGFNSDVNDDGIIDMADISIAIDHFLEEI
jgi:hypothetical protein